MQQVGRGNAELGDRAVRRDAANLLGVGFDEPEIPIWTSGNGTWLAVRRGNRELGQLPGWRESTDQAAEFREPEIVVWPRDETTRIIAGLGNRELRENTADCD